MKLQHTTHSLQRSHTAARNNSALLLFDYFPSGDLAQTESRSISTAPVLSVPFVKLSFTYDEAGNRASVSEDFGATATEITPVTTSYTYDPAGRISTISDNTLTTFNYDGHGRRSQMRRSYLNLDHVTRYEYNSSGLLHSIAHHAPDTSLINQFAYETRDRPQFLANISCEFCGRRGQARGNSPRSQSPFLLLLYSCAEVMLFMPQPAAFPVPVFCWFCALCG